MAVRRNSQNHASGILNVLLHGAFTFVLEENANQILALIPRLHDHTYRAGSWLAETELQGGPGATYELTGVMPGKEFHFDHEKNLVVKFRGKLPAKPPHNARRYATLRFPKPRMITSLRVAEIPTKDFSPKPPKNLVVPGPNQHMATLQVFTYDIDKENELALKAVNVSLPRATKLEDHYWEPAFTGNNVNLHIFSSEDYYHKASNVVYDLNQCIALLGVNLEVDVRYVPARGIPATDESTLKDLGVTAIETEDLASRTRRLADLGRRVAQNGDADLAWYGTDVLDGGGELCGDAVGES